MVSGLSALAAPDFADIAERYAGQSLDKSGLQGMARAVADRARDRGYIFASAAISPQQIDAGIVTVSLDEGAIDTVRITGTDNSRVERLLNALIGEAVRRETVERQILLAEDVPGIEIVRTRFVRDQGRGVLIVEAREDGARGSVTLDNFGPDAFGPVRLRIETDLTGLLSDSDMLTTYSIVTPSEPSELGYVSVRYAVFAGDVQLALTAAAGRTRNIDRARGFRSAGRSRSIAASAALPIARSRNTSFWINGEIAYLNVEQRDLGLSDQRDDLVTLTLSGNGNLALAGGRLYGGLSFTQGLGIFGANRAGNPASSRGDGSGVFTKAQAWLNWVGTIAGPYAMRLAANGQIASHPLLASQEVGLGGPGFGRGFDFSERFGDQGILGLVELRRNFEQPAGWLDSAQLYGFADGGYIDNLRDGIGDGTLVSAGGGIRAGVGQMELGVEVAVPINVERLEPGDKSPKVNLSVSYSF